jgi:hypothetical protein
VTQKDQLASKKTKKKHDIASANILYLLPFGSTLQTIILFSRNVHHKQIKLTTGKTEKAAPPKYRTSKFLRELNL